MKKSLEMKECSRLIQGRKKERRQVYVVLIPGIDGQRDEAMSLIELELLYEEEEGVLNQTLFQ